jgi:hypothetical protein
MIKLNVESKKKDGDLFAIWYLVTAPKNHHSLQFTNADFGFKNQFNGIAIYVYVENGKWYLHAMQDLGIQKIDLSFIK